MGAFSLSHLIILLVVILLVFGTKKLKNLGSDLGGAIKGFKNAMEDEKKDDGTNVETRQLPGADTTVAKSSTENVDEKR